MTTEIEKSRVEEIIALHNEIGGYLKMSLEKAIRLGELLTEQKKDLQHGLFTEWIQSNMPFTDRTARNYMRIYRERDRLKTETVSDLKSAYKLLKSPEPDFEGLELTKAREWENVFTAFNIKFEALKTLEKQTNDLCDSGSISVQEKINALAHLSKRALNLSNEIAEYRIRSAREAGRCLLELEDFCSDVDWIGIIQDDRSHQRLMGMIDARIQELSA